MEKSLAKLEKKLNINFHDKKLLSLALTHSSYAKKILKKKNADNERLEYLGDAILKLIVSMHLYKRFPNYNEGQLTKIRSKMIGDQFLATIAKQVQLGDYMKFSFGEKKNGGNERNSNLANAFEALLGAMYLDQGFDKTSDFFLPYLQKYKDVLNQTIDYKSKLQELLQKAKSQAPIYEIENEHGPDHQKKFDIKATILYKNKTYHQSSSAHTKKEAEQIAAQKLLEQIEENKNSNKKNKPIDKKTLENLL